MTEVAAFCVACGTALVPAAQFCSTCGHPVGSPSGGTAPSPPPPPTPPPPPPGAQGRSGTALLSPATPQPLGTPVDSPGPYPQTSVLLAVLLTLAAPFISLIAALALMQDQRIQARREQLKSWAIASGVWLVVGGVLFIAIVASIAGGSSSAGCKGGINHLDPPSYIGSTGHWTAVYTCNNGGTLTRPAHAAWLDR